MNKLFSIVLLLSLICAGCSTVEKSIATTAITVDSAMKGWATHVAMGKATPQDELRVKSAYINYQTSMRAVRAAYSAANIDKTMTAQEALEYSLKKLEENRVILLDLINTIEKGL